MVHKRQNDSILSFWNPFCWLFSVVADYNPKSIRKLKIKCLKESIFTITSMIYLYPKLCSRYLTSHSFIFILILSCDLYVIGEASLRGDYKRCLPFWKSDFDFLVKILVFHLIFSFECFRDCDLHLKRYILAE